MPRGVYDRSKRKEREPAADKPQVFGFENTITIDGIDHLLLQAEADELAGAVISLLAPQLRADLLASIMQSRLNRLFEPPANLPELAERLQSFAPPPQPTENPDNAEAGLDPA